MFFSELYFVSSFVLGKSLLYSIKPLPPIQVYSDGKMSSYVRTWQVGDMVEWRGPFGRFLYTPNQVTHLQAGINYSQ